MSNILYLSDIHLEASNISFIGDIGEDFIVIAGDLSSDLYLLEDFFLNKISKTTPIIYVLGNHEYEGRRWNDTEKLICDIVKKFKNVHLLNNNSIEIGKIKFIGSTLWTNFEETGTDTEENKKWAKNNIADLNNIFTLKSDNKYSSITADEIISKHNDAVKYLTYELKQPSDCDTKIVISHFAPSKKSKAKEYAHINSSYWSSNIENLVGLADIWIHGHTHSTFNYFISETNVLCNPRGWTRLFDMASNTTFDKNKILSIKPIKQPTPKKGFL